jgi:hypothetical protein
MTDLKTTHPDHDDIPVLKITMEQRGCLIEVNVPEKALPDVMDMKEYMRNTGADMYARLLFMMRQAEQLKDIAVNGDNS